MKTEPKDVAIRAVKEAGKLLMKHFGKPTIIGSHYSRLNPQTKEDKLSELVVVSVIKNSFPEHGFLGEELGEQNQSSEYKWIIDPIDGTNNYVDGRDSFSISIGLEYNGKIILGVVYLPKRDELFIAEVGKGATLNGESIHVSDTSDLKKAVVTYSTFPGHEEETQSLDERINREIPNIKFFGYKEEKDLDPTFGRGSMAAEFCFLACGRIDGLIRLKQKPWDVAAGSLIASEAGAKSYNLEGDEPSVDDGDYVSANEELSDKLLELVKE